MPNAQFTLSLPATWTTIDSIGDSVTEAIRSGRELRADALLRLESRTFSGHLSARDAADLTVGRECAENTGMHVAQAVDRDFGATAQALRVLVDESAEPAFARAYVMIAEAPEDQRSRVVPTLVLQWSPPDAEVLGPEFEHVISSFRFSPPASDPDQGAL